MCTYFPALEDYPEEIEVKKEDLLQFTGLYDRNEMPIYEGDILKEGYWIGWYLNRWVFAELEDLESVQNEGNLDNDCEVIGNVYENGSLLNEKEITMNKHKNCRWVKLILRELPSVVGQEQRTRAPIIRGELIPLVGNRKDILADYDRVTKKTRGYLERRLRRDKKEISKTKRSGILKSDNFEEDVKKLKKLARKIKESTEKEKNENKRSLPKI